MTLLAHNDDRPHFVSAPQAPGERSGVASHRLLFFAVLAGLPVVVSAWLLLSPGRMVATALTPDVLLHLENAWSVYQGQVVHVDFHVPVGELCFLLTALGFHVVGFSPMGFVIGNLVFAVAIFAAASCASTRRLPLVPAAIFTVFATMLVLMPANMGDSSEGYGFASYDRCCWSALSILALIFFVAPLPHSPKEARRVAGGTAIDLVVAAVLMVALFYLEVTFFVSALAALGLALVFHPHVRRRAPDWLVVGGIAAANAVAPHSWPYLLDIWNALQDDQARAAAGGPAKIFVASAESYATYAAAVVLAAWLWWEERAPLRLPLTVGFLLLLATGLSLLMQGQQTQGLPLCVVIAFLFYDAFCKQDVAGEAAPSEASPRSWSPRPRAASVQRAVAAPIAVALMMFPLAAIATSASSVLVHSRKAWQAEGLRTADPATERAWLRHPA